MQGLRFRGLVNQPYFVTLAIMEEDVSLGTDVKGAFFLESAQALLRSGASSDRIRTTIQRLSMGSGFTPHISIMPLSISISLHDQQGKIAYSGTASIPAQGVNFSVVSGISHLSWDIALGNQTLDQAKAELSALQKLPHYNRWLLLVMVGLAGAGFCFTFGGTYVEMLVGFLATFIGLFCKQQMIQKTYNAYIITFVSSIVAGAIVGLARILLPEIPLEHAFSTCVLFLIPGVPLINSITDLIEGYTLNGVARGVGAFIHAMAIAFGLVVDLFIFGII